MAKEAAGRRRSAADFSAKGYKYKELSDYGVGGAATGSTAEAEEAIKSAELFIDCIATQLAKSDWNALANGVGGRHPHPALRAISASAPRAPSGSAGAPTHSELAGMLSPFITTVSGPRRA